MKKITLSLISLSILLGLLYSCQNNDDMDVDTPSTSSLNDKWTDVYRYNFDSEDDAPVDLIPNVTPITRAYDVEVGDARVYPTQNIVHSQFKQEGRWNEIFCKINPHHLIFDFTPVPYICEVSKPQGYLSYSMALGKAMQSKEWDISSASTMKGKAEASFKDVKTYQEFNLAFGANGSVGKFFSSSMSYTQNSKKYKTTFVARFKASCFDVVAYLDNKVTQDRPVYESQSYVSSLTYGKVSYLVIFSNYSYDYIKKSINATFSAGIVGGGGNYSKETLDILSTSESYAFVSGNDITEPFFGNTPSFLNKLFSATFDKTTIGTPIFFQLRDIYENNLVDANKGYSWVETPIVYITINVK